MRSEELFGDFLGVIPNHIRKSLNAGYLGKAARTAQIQTVVVSRDNLNETLVGQPVREIYVPVNIAGQPYAILYVACEVSAKRQAFHRSQSNAARSWDAARLKQRPEFIARSQFHH